MKYFYDTEFLEGKQDKRFLGIKYDKTKPTIDLISIGIVSEDDREFYAISKDFNLKEAWNRCDIAEQTPYEKYNGFSGRKIYWLRENVLKPIYINLNLRDINNLNIKFTYKDFKRLINKYGKSNKQIAKEVQRFIEKDHHINCNTNQLVDDRTHTPVELYGYYSDYDHVVLSWLFGKMINLPKGFPMYTKDLKQSFDFYNNNFKERLKINAVDKYKKFKDYKELPNYPKETNSHSAIHDARWNKELYKFIQTL